MQSAWSAPRKTRSTPAHTHAERNGRGPPTPKIGYCHLFNSLNPVTLALFGFPKLEYTTRRAKVPYPWGGTSCVVLKGTYLRGFWEAVVGCLDQMTR